MELWELRCFLGVAKEGTFTGAAESLGLSQPALSRQMDRFERNLGVRVFTRHNKGVILTSSGRTLVKDAERIVLMAEQFESLGKKLGRGRAGLLRVGCVQLAMMEFFPRVLRAFRNDVDFLDVHVTEVETSEQVEAILRGDLDVGLVRVPKEDPNLVSRKIREVPLVAAVPDNHPRAHAARLQVKDLSGDNFIMYERRLGPLFQDLMISYCQESGFTPNIVKEAREFYTILSLVSAGMGVSLLAVPSTDLSIPGVVFIPLDEPCNSIPLTLVWRKGEVSPVGARFIDYCSKLAV